MPSHFVCANAEPCEGEAFAYPSEALEHMRVTHPGAPLPLSLPTVRIPREGPPPLRIFCCRVCALRVTTREPILPYCAEHMPSDPQPEEL